MSLDLIITNASILTMDPANPRAEAIGISGNRISHLGSTTEVMGEKRANTHTSVRRESRSGPYLPSANAGPGYFTKLKVSDSSFPS